jgi:hypothetical protein
VAAPVAAVVELGVVVVDEVAVPVVDEVGTFPPVLHAAINALAAVALSPRRANRRMASRRDNNPSRWSVAISSAK